MPESFGAEYVAPTSYMEVINALPAEVLVLSILLAALPFIMRRLQKNSGVKNLLIKLFAIRLNIKEYIEHRSMEKSAKEEFNRFTQKDKSNILWKGILLDMAISGLLLALVLTKSIFFGIVTTQSMVPALYPRELVLIEGLTKDVKAGDIIVFKKPGYEETVIHRVFSVEDGAIRTKGDNADIDPWALRKKDIMGKAVTIFGKPLKGLKNIGYYFMPIRTPFAATDPSIRAMTDAISVLRIYGPVIAVVLLVLAFITPSSRRKKYYGKLG